MVPVSSKKANARPRPSTLKAKQPTIGWVLISRAEVAQAEALLNDRQRGVVDELGLLSIHQAFADRLFPGTSVLHTRLRYALFVPWLMERAARSANPVQSLAQLEFSLTGQLKRGLQNNRGDEDDRGIIGSRVYEKGKHAAQPASFSYWSALATWGILGRDYMRAAPSREAVLEALKSERKACSTTDTDGQSLSTEPAYFGDLPPPPAGFLDDPKGVTFKLLPREKRYLRNRLAALKAPTLDGEKARESFLGALARHTVTPTFERDFWNDREVVDCVPPEDRKLIPLARDISALGGIVRAVYLALVEQACADKKYLKTRQHRDHLIECRAKWADEALQADLDALVADGLGLKKDSLYDLLTATKDWLGTSTALPDASIKRLYANVEHGRKLGRSRLTGTPGASQQLRHWARFAERSTPASRLHFRWPNVRRLIRDLHE
ncbi:hypothetical protein GO305_02941 [Ralstonia solanacearum]|nr:hypothetical protein [Ralstonia solanacearum]